MSLRIKGPGRLLSLPRALDPRYGVTRQSWSIMICSMLCFITGTNRPPSVLSSLAGTTDEMDRFKGGRTVAIFHRGPSEVALLGA